jgi:hypothetical protein
MAQVDTYLSHLVHSKYQGNVIILEAENKLLQLKVAELEKNNESNRVFLRSLVGENTSFNHHTVELNIREQELRIKNILNTIELNCLIIERFEYLIKSKVSN